MKNSSFRGARAPAAMPWWALAITGCHTARIILLLPVISLSAGAATVTLQPGVNGYTGAADAWLDESAQTRNYGGSTYVQVQYNSGMSDSTLLRFPLPALGFTSLGGATLGLYYYDQSSMSGNNAVGITPYRLKPGMGWFENVYDGTAGYGVNWRWRDAAQTQAWTSQYGAWNDKLDDGNSSARIKPAGGSATNAIAPPNWVTWNVLNTVAQWHGGQENNGFVLFESSFEGSGYIAAGRFYSREFGTASLRPYLNLAYQGAQISWAGYVNGVWDSATLNWNVGGWRGAFGAGDFVRFSDYPTNAAVTVAAAGVAPGSITVSNTVTPYTFSGGGIGGTGGFTKAGSGTVTLAASNTYSGPTLLTAGTLALTTNSALGGAAAGTSVSNGAALVFLGGVNYSHAEPLLVTGAGPLGNGALYALNGSNRFAGDVTLAGQTTVGVSNATALALLGAIQGGFDLVKTGAGTLLLGGGSPNTLGGAARIGQGALVLAKSAGLSAVPAGLVLGGGGSGVSARLDASGQLGPACDVTVRENCLLDLNGFDSTIRALTLSGGAVATGTGTLTLGGDLASTGGESATLSGRLDLGGAQRQVNVSDPLALADLLIPATVSNGGLVKTGPGRLVLSGDNSFAGDCVASNGVLTITHANALGATARGTTVAPGARLELRDGVAVGAEPLLLNSVGAGYGALRSVAGTNSWAGPVLLASDAALQCEAGQLTLSGPFEAGAFRPSFNAFGDILLSGAVNGSGAELAKFGAGTLFLTGNRPNTFTGVTRVFQGTLVLAKQSAVAVAGDLTIGVGVETPGVRCEAPDQVSPTCNLRIRAGGLLDLNNHPATAASLTFTGGAVDTGPAGQLRLHGPLAADGAQPATVLGNLHLSGPPQPVRVATGAALYLPASVTGEGFVKQGGETLFLMGSNHFTGGSTIAEGTVLVNTPPPLGCGLGPGPVIVDSGGTLGGVGCIAGPVLVRAGGTLSPGTSVGTLRVAGLAHLQADGLLLAEVGGDGGALMDQLDLRGSGELRLDDGSRLAVSGPLKGAQPHFLVRNAASVSGAFRDLPEGGPLPPPNEGWFIHYGTHRVFFSRVARPLVYFRAFATNGVVVNAWRTAEEVETHSFDLFQWDGADWQRVNDAPVPAQGAGGGVYALVNSLAEPDRLCRFRLVANTPEGAEISEFERLTSEFAFSAAPRWTEDGLELRWWARVDETYDLLGTPSLTEPHWEVLEASLPATPPECVLTNRAIGGEGYFRLRLTP